MRANDRPLSCGKLGRPKSSVQAWVIIVSLPLGKAHGVSAGGRDRHTVIKGRPALPAVARKNAPPRAVRTGVDDSALTFGPRAVPLSVLDLAPVPDGGTAAEALRATTDLAQ